MSLTGMVLAKLERQGYGPDKINPPSDYGSVWWKLLPKFQIDIYWSEPWKTAEFPLTADVSQTAKIQKQ